MMAWLPILLQEDAHEWLTFMAMQFSPGSQYFI